MKQFHIPILTGLVKDYKSRQIKEDKVSEALNVCIDHGTIYNRWGIGSYGLTLPVVNPITAIHFYEKTESKHIVVFTTKDAFAYTPVTGQFSTITQCYSTGTVTSSGAGNKTITVTGGTFDSTRLGVDAYYIKFGTTNPDDATKDWNLVSSISSTSVLTLTNNLTVPVSGSTYVLKYSFQSDYDTPQCVITAYDDYVGDKILLVTNKLDPMQYWGGTGYLKVVKTRVKVNVTYVDANTLGVDDFNGLENAMTVDETVNGYVTLGKTISAINTTLSQITVTSHGMTVGQTDTVTFTNNIKPNKAKFVFYAGSVGYEHILSGSTFDDTTNFPQTVEVSNAGYTAWDGTFYTFQNTPDVITGFATIGQRIYCFKERSITEIYPNPSGGNSDPLDFIQNKIQNIGTPSYQTIVTLDNNLIFYGEDNIYMFDGNSLMPIGNDIIQDLRNSINKNYKNRCFAVHVKEKSWYCLFIPSGDNQQYCNKTYVFNYEEKNWVIWELDKEIAAITPIRKTVAPTWSDIASAGITWAEWGARWSDLIKYAENITYLVGDVNGAMYELSSIFTDDNGVAIVSRITTKDYPLNQPFQMFKFLQLILGFSRNNGFSIRVRVSVDFGTTWSSWLTIPMDGTTDYVEYISQWNEKGLQLRLQIENVNSAPFAIENMTIGFNDSGDKRSN